jgi:hypothetical protein
MSSHHCSSGSCGSSNGRSEIEQQLREIFASTKGVLDETARLNVKALTEQLTACYASGCSSSSSECDVAFPLTPSSHTVSSDDDVNHCKTTTNQSCSVEVMCTDRRNQHLDHKTIVQQTLNDNSTTQTEGHNEQQINTTSVISSNCEENSITTNQKNRTRRRRTSTDSLQQHQNSCNRTETSEVMMKMELRNIFANARGGLNEEQLCRVTSLQQRLLQASAAHLISSSTREVTESISVCQRQHPSDIRSTSHGVTVVESTKGTSQLSTCHHPEADVCLSNALPSTKRAHIDDVVVPSIEESSVTIFEDVLPILSTATSTIPNQHFTKHHSWVTANILPTAERPSSSTFVCSKKCNLHTSPTDIFVPSSSSSAFTTEDVPNNSSDKIRLASTFAELGLKSWSSSATARNKTTTQHNTEYTITPIVDTPD